MELREFYTNIGADYDKILQRLRNEALIKKYLKKLPEDKNYLQLKDAIEAGDYETAFAAAHTIKGMCLNLELTTLVHSSSILTQTLREKKPDDVISEIYREFERDYDNVMKGIKEII